MDGREWLDDYRNRLEDVRARAARAERALAAVAGAATSRDGAVVVTVDQAGALQHLELTEHAEVLSRKELAATVVDTARRAREEAARQAEAALVPVFGERSAAMEVFRSHLALPER
ncbi:YbaB/EbfC DNA-binding family protein [Pseudonocardia hierapolitana]|uniref:YbaB/EbfC DNA-binding family protein n=1 Tax=Pseudonocardia hierapolitana TaxID=1128676 RepID=A0A561SWF0_9PSEU|nr:YbaB/EbfC family nucleoid-associated protein [Pseudonocardia hierapolitana]TWF79190.1 YbaB/EbfC DNA-binding family protein [Pseudonocardia hierapolitana]